MSKVVVLAGGDSDEREVSLRSGAAVKMALETAGHSITMADPVKDLVSYLNVFRSADVVFPALHGKGGEDGGLQGFLERHGLAFVGSDSRAAALCFDKYRYYKLLSGQAITQPATELVDYEAYLKSKLIKRPFVLKPNDGGSSIDTFIMRGMSHARKVAVKDAFARHTKLLIQSLIEGTEITVGIVGEQSLPVIEIIPPSNQEFDYTNKYNGATQEICPPKSISKELQLKARELALALHHLCGCRDLSRSDMILSPDNKLYVLETNTIPGLTEQSLLPRAAAVAGMSMPELCDFLVVSALDRR